MGRIVRAAGPWEYFVRKVRIGRPDACWEWQGSCGGPGYGNWSYSSFGGKRVRSAHRATYELFFGAPGKAQVNHRCGNRKCCNPDHLYAGTQFQNYLDMLDHGTHTPPPQLLGSAKRNQFGASQLDESKVREIRRRAATGERHKVLASDYGVSVDVVHKVAVRKNWAWVKD